VAVASSRKVLTAEGRKAIKLIDDDKIRPGRKSIERAKGPNETMQALINDHSPQLNSPHLTCRSPRKGKKRIRHFLPLFLALASPLEPRSVKRGN